MSHLLHEHINGYLPLSEQEFQHCLSYFTHRRFRKRQYILQEGQLQQTSIFILNGLVRTYEVDDSGGEHIFQFHRETEWVFPSQVTSQDMPAKFNVDCVEDTEVLMLANSSKRLMLESLPKMCQYFHLQLEESYVHLVKRVSSHLSKPTAERYYEFIEQHQPIQQRVPNHFIASYLGITPQSLSRIRAQARQAVS